MRSSQTIEELNGTVDMLRERTEAVIVSRQERWWSVIGQPLAHCECATKDMSIDWAARSRARVQYCCTTAEEVPATSALCDSVAAGLARCDWSHVGDVAWISTHSSTQHCKSRYAEARR